MSKIKIDPKIPLFFGVIPFLIGAIDAIKTGHTLMIIANLFLVAANLMLLKFTKKNLYPVNGTLMLLNGLMAMFISYNYYQLAKVGLPYAWLFISLINFLASIMFFRKHFRPDINSEV